ncbi:MAG: hypothetical protein AAF684_05270 [Pseudomonadota bacterium]
MKHLEDYVSPSRADLATFNAEDAQRIDQINKEIYRRNRIVVQKAKTLLRAASPEARTVHDLEPPAVPIEYARKFREQLEKEREAAAAYEERMMGSDRGGAR